MSVTGRIWNILYEDTSQPLLKRLLTVRGLTKDEEIDAFLNDTGSLHDPYGLKDMKLAVKRIKEAVNLGQKIIVFGDYDVDGISGAAVLISALERIGAQVSYRLPHRVNDGYGLTDEFVEEFQKIGVSLVITVDCGISCAPQISKAKEYGIDAIITDHHTIPEDFPHDAYAILHPLQEDCNYVFPHLSGSGMAFKLASALLKEYLSKEGYEREVEKLCDLACLGTVADMVPLFGENRTIVKKGLEGIKVGRWPGLNAIIQTSKLNSFEGRWNADLIGYGIGPRLNAAGRISEPMFALQTLLGKKNPEKLAAKLEDLNEKRKVMTYKALDELSQRIEKMPSNKKIIIANSKDWHTGIIGLLAGKTAERYKKPVIIMEDRGDELVGSSRSPEFFSIVDALRQCKDMLESFGGHTQAAGFTIKKKELKKFVEKIEKIAEEELKITQIKQQFDVDTVSSLSELDWSAYEDINALAPFGVGNKKPKFLIKGLEARNVRIIGGDRRHLRFDVFEDDTNGTSRGLQVIGFNMAEHAKDLFEGRKIDIVAHLDKNTWNNDTFLQLRLIDFSI